MAEKKKSSQNTALKVSIQPKDVQPLSKNQIEFNRLTEQIECLQKQIETKSSDIQVIRAQWVKQIIPLKNQEIEQRFLLIEMLSKKAKSQKFGKRQIQQIGEVIVNQLDDLFSYMEREPSQEEKALYDEWADCSYDEVLEETNEQGKQMFKDLFSSMTGINISDEDIEDGPEAFFAKYESRLRDMDREGEKSSSRGNTQQRKTKKQLEREEKLRAEEAAAEEIKSKSLRSIYIALAKVLHPDVATDGIDSVEREELMKKVTKAYEEKDLTTLLRLEMEWVHKQVGHLDTLSDEKLGVYIKVLREQKQDLEREYAQLIYDPRNGGLRDYFRGTMQTAKRKIKKSAQTIEEAIREDRETLRFIEDASKTEFMQYISVNASRHSEFDDFLNW